jgi:hypothetical protein
MYSASDTDDQEDQSAYYPSNYSPVQGYPETQTRQRSQYLESQSNQQYRRDVPRQYDGAIDASLGMDNPLDSVPMDNALDSVPMDTAQVGMDNVKDSVPMDSMLPGIPGLSRSIPSVSSFRKIPTLPSVRTGSTITGF